MIPVLLLIAGGSVVTAVIGGDTSALKGASVGIALQVSSSVCYAMKYVVMKLIFSPPATS